MKLLSSTNRCRTRWDWVEGHAVEQKGWHNSTLPKRLNHQSDILAKDALISAIAGGSLMKGDFPFEPIRFKLSGKRVCSSPRLSLEKDWGYRTARALFAEKDIMHTEDFHLVWWDGLDSAMAGYPKTFRTFITKQVSGWCSCNSKLSLWEDDIVNECPQCGCKHENSKHLTGCRDPGQVL